ncbi:hypothetical protein ABTX61_10295 [Amycolatopsis japonica]|uniref:hypothetical protein n=1 Tax=Amycolatopsis japonica TaxID=208439 RepID=UPI003317FF9C
MTVRSGAKLVPVLVAVLAATATPAIASAAPPPKWGPCPEEAAGLGLECGVIEVPLDYRTPGGKTIEIAISRLSSTRPEKRRGVCC